MKNKRWTATATAVVLLAGTVAGCAAQAATADRPGDVSQVATGEPVAPPTPTTEPAEEATPLDTAGGGTSGGDVVADPAAEQEQDGTWPALIVEVRPGVLVLDRIEILAGAEAAAAMAEDGMAVEEGVDVPYLRNRNPKLRELPVGDVTVEVYDCDTGCQLVPWSYDKLTEGTPLPYGHEATAWSVTVSGGEVVHVAEVYLP